MLVFAGCEDQHCLLYQDLPGWGRSWPAAGKLVLSSPLWGGCPVAAPHLQGSVVELLPALRLLPLPLGSGEGTGLPRKHLAVTTS